MKKLISPYLIAFSQKIGERHNRIFILPTRPGIYFLVITFVLFLISLSYGHSLAFTTTFIFVSLVMTSAHFTNFNLSGIEVMTVNLPADIYAGEATKVKLTLRNESRKHRFDIVSSLYRGDDCEPISLAPGETKVQLVNLPPLNRGHYQGKRVRLSSAFPFGLFRAWKFWKKEFDFYVYPQRLAKRIELGKPDIASSERGRVLNKVEIGAEEFYGHFNYQEGMPLRSIDWQAYARGRGILLKKFVEQSDGLYLFTKANERGSVEEVLKSLTTKVEEAEFKGVTYGLVLGTEKPQFGRGQSFKRMLLKRLAAQDKESREVIV